MSVEKRKVLVDTDFINHVINSGSNEKEGENLLATLCDELGVIPYVHPWIADNEFVLTKTKNTIKHGIVKKLSWDEIVGTDSSMLEFYEMVVKDLYKKMQNEDLDLSRCSIKDLRMSRSSLGEIQTIIVAQQLNIPVFYSNDRGSKFLATKVNSSAFTLEVYDTPEIAIKISQNSNTNIEEKYCISMIHNATEDDKKKAKKCIAIVKENYRCTHN